MRSVLTSILFILYCHGLSAKNLDSMDYDTLELLQDFGRVEGLLDNREYQKAFLRTQEIYQKANTCLSPNWACYATARATGMTLQFKRIGIPAADSLYNTYNSKIDSLYKHQRSELSLKAVESLNYLTLLHARMQLNNRAIELTRYQVRRLKELGMAHGLKLAIPLSNRAAAFGYMELHDSNIYYIGKVLNEVENFKNDRLRWKEIMLNNLGNAYLQLGEPERALVYIEAAQEQAKQDSSQHGRSRAIGLKQNIAIILISLNKPVEALELLNQIEALYIEKNIQNPQLWGSLYHEKAICLGDLKDTTSARFFLKSYEWYSKDSKLKTKAEVAYMKYLHKKRKRKKNVSDEIIYTKDIIRNQLVRGETHGNDLSSANMFLGRLYFQMEYYDSAYAVSNKILSAAKNPDADPVKGYLDNPSFLHSVSDHYFQQALELKGATCLEQYKLNQDVSKLHKAQEHIQYALNHLNHLRKSRLYGTSKSMDFDFSKKTHETGLRVSKHLLSHEYDTSSAQLVLDLFESAKCLLLSQSIHDKRVKKHITIPDSLARNQIRFLERIEETKARIILLDDDTMGLAKLKKTQLISKLKLDTLKELLRDQYPAYDAYRRQFNTVRLQQLQNEVLDDETAMIQYFVGTWNIYVLAIASDGIFLDSVFISKEVVGALGKFHELTSTAPKLTTESFEDQLNNYATVGNSAFNVLFPKGILEYITSKKKLIIVPYGSLNYIPFEALLTRQVDKTEKVDYSNLPYLMHQFDIQYAYSATWLYQHKDHKTRELSYLGVAPSYDVELMKNSDELIPFRAFRDNPTPLTGNLTEIERTKGILGGDVLIGDNATEQNFRVQSKNHSILHFAMHGLMDDNRPMNSQLLFSSGQDTVDDGSLFAYELYGLPLNADLVVMTACNSGNGKLEQGEGVMSLARAFSDAGCPSLVTSLWQVDDLSASDLVTNFFKNIQKGQSKSSSLRDAKLRYLKTAEPTRSHPFYWANLIVMGNDQPLVKKTEMPVWWIIAAGATLIFVFGITLRKKAAAKAA